MAPSDLDQLIEMGFDKERAQIAISKTGGCKSNSTFLQAQHEHSFL